MSDVTPYLPGHFPTEEGSAYGYRMCINTNDFIRFVLAFVISNPNEKRPLLKRFQTVPALPCVLISSSSLLFRFRHILLTSPILINFECIQLSTVCTA